MTSLYGSAIDGSTMLTRRLSVLPSVLGLLSVLLVIATSAVAGIWDADPWGRPLTVVTAVCVAITIVWGHPVGLYVGAVVFVVAALLADEPLTTGPLIVMVVGLLLVHEVARASLDARHPARFGPSLWPRYAATTVLVAAALAAAAVFGAGVRGLEAPEWLVPLGLVLAAVPLLARRVVTGKPDRGVPVDTNLGPLGVRAALGVVVAAAAITGAVLGAEARTGIEGGTGPDPTESSGPVTTTTNLPEVLDDAGVVERGVSLLAFLVVMLIVGLIYAALKRPQPTFDLDDLDMEDIDTTLGLAGPGHADLDDVDVEIDEGEFARLLDELALDIGSERDPGRAVRYAYANVERRLADARIERDDAETEQEFLTRALPSLGGRGEAMITLTRLFEAARFGHRPITEDMRNEALAAVEQLRTATAEARAAAEAEPVVPKRKLDDNRYPVLGQRTKATPAGDGRYRGAQSGQAPTPDEDDG